VRPVQRAERGLDRAEVLGAEFAEGAERLVYAVEGGFVVGDFEVRCALRDKLGIVREGCMCVWGGCVRQRGLRREAWWALCVA